MKPILLSSAGNTENQDRGLVVCDGPRMVLCVADGAGGRSGGTEAAVMAVDFVGRNSSMITHAEGCSELLRQMDAAIAKDAVAGETTCVIAILTPDGIFGASVGDSGAWLISDAERPTDLTRLQQRKPFIGSGSAWPVPFQSVNPKGCFMLASDGCLNTHQRSVSLRPADRIPPRWPRRD